MYARIWDLPYLSPSPFLSHAPSLSPCLCPCPSPYLCRASLCGGGWCDGDGYCVHVDLYPCLDRESETLTYREEMITTPVKVELSTEYPLIWDQLTLYSQDKPPYKYTCIKKVITNW